MCTKCIPHTLSIIQHVSAYHTCHHQGAFVVVNITLSNGKRPYIFFLLFLSAPIYINKKSDGIPKPVVHLSSVSYSLEVRVVSSASGNIFGKLQFVCVCVCVCVCLCSSGENTVKWHNLIPVEVMK